MIDSGEFTKHDYTKFGYQGDKPWNKINTILDDSGYSAKQISRLLISLKRKK
jgi:hypothetical protein